MGELDAILVTRPNRSLSTSGPRWSEEGDEGRHGSANDTTMDNTVIIASPYRSISLAACIFREVYRSRAGNPANTRFLARNYAASLHEVDISFVRDLLLMRPKVIGFSSFFWNERDNLQLAKLAKSLLPECVTVFGGPQTGGPSCAHALVDEHSFIDAVIPGEADFLFPEFVLRAVSGGSIAGLTGIITKNTPDSTGDTPCNFIEDLERVPVVYYKGNEFVLQSVTNLDVVPLQTARGCRQGCSYCLYGATPLRMFPLARVEEEIAFLCANAVKTVRVCDGHFGGSRKRALELFEIAAHYNTRTQFHIYPDPHHLDREYVAYAEKANCRILSLSLASTDPGVCHNIHRAYDACEFSHALAAARGGGAPPRVDLMYGLPGQTAESFKEDLLLLKRSGVNRVLFSPLMVFPGCALDAQSEPMGIGTLDVPQRFGIPRSMRLGEYASFMLSALLYDLLAGLARVDRYLRFTLGDGAGYDGAVGRWLDAGRLGALDAVLELDDGLQSGSHHVRRTARPLAARAANLLSDVINREEIDTPLLRELARLDILEIAMRKRRRELERDIVPHVSITEVIDAETAARSRWILSEESWLECHEAPAQFEADDCTKNWECSPSEMACVFCCPRGRIYHIGPSDCDFLRSFTMARSVFDEEHPYSSAVLDRVFAWSGRGVLQLA